MVKLLKEERWFDTCKALDDYPVRPSDSITCNMTEVKSDI
jgi:hypothetical protein